MKRFGILAAGLCAAFALSACNSTETQNTSAGAVGAKTACCTDGKTCSTDAKTCAKGAACCKSAEAKSSMGAVSGTGECATKKAECSATKAECTGAKAACPATAKDASMGTVSDAPKSGCCSKAAKSS